MVSKVTKGIIISFWLLFAIAVGAVVLLFSAIAKGSIGYMLPVEQLENPIDKYASQVVSADGKTLGIYAHSQDNRIMVNYNDLSPDLVKALIATEDVRFAEHSGIDAQGLFRAVVKRGILMQNAVPDGKGAMAAVLGLDAEKIEAAIAGIEGVSIANYNCPGQIVISGKKAAVEEACEKLKAAGAKRALLLNVSGPFHSGMLTVAGEKLAQVLADVEIHTPRIPYVANVNAQFVTTAEPVKDLLTRQVSSSVRWQQSVEAMINDGVDTFIEIGPGRTLAGFMKKISKEVKTMNVEKLEDIEKVAEALK